jgi:hypothetical protein
MPNTNTNTTNPSVNFKEDELKIYEFVNTLIQAMIGYSLVEVPEEHREEIVKNCIDAFIDFVIGYIEARYDKKDAIRLRASQQFAGQEIFSKFADLGDKFDEAFEAFKTSLTVSWKNKTQAA